MAFAVVHLLCFGIRCVGVAAVGIEYQTTPCARQCLTHGSFRTAKADLTHAQRIFVQIGVLTRCILNHTIAGIHRQYGIFGGAIGIRLGYRRVDFVTDVNGHCTRINATFTIGHCVGEGSWAIVGFVGGEGHRTIWIQCHSTSTVFERHHITWFHRCAINFSDGQRVLIRIFVISQYIDGDWGVFFGGGGVVCHNWWIVHRRYGDIDIGGYWCRAIADGVVESRWTIVVGFRREGDGAVSIQSSRTVFNRYRHTHSHILTINLFDHQLVTINIGVIGQYFDDDWGIFRSRGCIIRGHRCVVQRSDRDIQGAFTAGIGGVVNGRHCAIPVRRWREGVVTIGTKGDGADFWNRCRFTRFERTCDTVNREAGNAQGAVHIFIVRQYVATHCNIFRRGLAIRFQHTRIIHWVDCDIDVCG